MVTLCVGFPLVWRLSGDGDARFPVPSVQSGPWPADTPPARAVVGIAVRARDPRKGAAMSTRISSPRRVRRRVGRNGSAGGQAFASGLWIVVLLAVNVYPGWHTIPFLTAQAAGVLWLVNLCIVTRIIAHLVYIGDGAGRYRPLGDYLTSPSRPDARGRAPARPAVQVRSRRGASGRPPSRSCCSSPWSSPACVPPGRPCG